MAIAIDHGIVRKLVKTEAKVELFGEHTRGQMITRRWTGHTAESESKNVAYVTEIDFEPYFVMLENCCK